jgi:restriction system protein
MEPATTGSNVWHTHPISPPPAPHGAAEDTPANAPGDPKTVAGLARDAMRSFSRRHRPHYRDRRIQEAAELTATVAERQDDLDRLLARYLANPLHGIDMDSLKKPLPQAPDVAPEDSAPRPAPTWDHYAPKAPTGIGRLVSAGSYARKRAEAAKLFTMAVDAYEAAEAARKKRVAAKHGTHEDVIARARQQHANIDRFVHAVVDRDRKAVSRYFQQVLDQLRDPDGLPTYRRAGYVPDSGVLAVEWQLPTIDVVPAAASYEYVEATDDISTTMRPETERRRSYQRLIAQLALRAVHAVIGSDRYAAVDGVVFNGVVDAVDPVTHRTIRPCLISLRTTPEQFIALELASLDPAACARDQLAAEVSSRPEQLQPVEPVLDFAEADPTRIHRRRRH